MRGQSVGWVGAVLLASVVACSSSSEDAATPPPAGPDPGVSSSSGGSSGATSSSSSSSSSGTSGDPIMSSSGTSGATCDPSKGGITCNGKCIDSWNDAFNCGQCARICDSLSCEHDGCDPRVLDASEPDEITVNSTDIYTFTSANHIHSGTCTVRKVPKDAKPVTVLITMPECPWMVGSSDQALVWQAPHTDHLVACTLPACADAHEVTTSYTNQEPMAADATNAFWSQHNGVYTCPLAGCPAEGATKLFTVASSMLLATELVIEGDDVFALGHGEPTVYRCPKTGCNGTPEIVNAGSTSGRAENLVVTATHIAWAAVPSDKTQPVTYVTCPRTGCGGAAPNVVFSDAMHSYAVTFTLDANEIFYESSGGIVACPITGCTGAPRRVGAATSLTSIAIDATHLYFRQTGPGNVVSIPK